MGKQLVFRVEIEMNKDYRVELDLDTPNTLSTNDFINGVADKIGNAIDDIGIEGAVKGTYLKVTPVEEAKAPLSEIHVYKAKSSYNTVTLVNKLLKSSTCFKAPVVNEYSDSKGDDYLFVYDSAFIKDNIDFINDIDICDDAMKSLDIRKVMEGGNWTISNEQMSCDTMMCVNGNLFVNYSTPSGEEVTFSIIPNTF